MSMPEKINLQSKGGTMARDMPAIEKKIHEFVYKCTGEKVHLILGTEDQVAIESISRHGSTMLGTFWLRVLQNPNNYPVHHYPYRKMYKALGKHIVNLRVDTVNINVCLMTGKLTITGIVALDWFVMRFAAIIDAYQQPVVTGGQELKEPFDAEQKRLMKKVKKQILHRYIEDWPHVVVDEDMDILNARQIMKDVEETTHKQYDAETMSVGPLLGEKPTDEYYIDNLLSSKALADQLQTIGQGVMTDGATLYAVWSSLLNCWLSDSKTKVFIVTPAIDKPSLTRLCHIVLNNRLTGELNMLATPLHSHCGRLADIRREVIARFPPRDQVFIEYKVYNSMVFPQADFKAKFIAGLRDNVVEILLTSADAEVKHFQREHSSMVLFQRLSVTEFDFRFLAPIVASVS